MSEAPAKSAGAIRQAAAYAADPEKYRAKSRANRARDRDKTNAVVAASRAKRPDYMPTYLAAYYERNKEAIKARVRAREQKLKEALRPRNAERAMRRNAAKLRATPAWADLDQIREFYDLAARLTIETGVVHHVDHKVPLQSKKVCGLHVQANLEVLPKAANQSKGNRFWPDQ